MSNREQESLPRNLASLGIGLLGLCCILMIVASVIGGFVAVAIVSSPSDEMLRELMLIRSLMLGYVGAKGFRFLWRLANATP